VIPVIRQLALITDTYQGYRTPPGETLLGATCYLTVEPFIAAFRAFYGSVLVSRYPKKRQKWEHRMPRVAAAKKKVTWARVSVACEQLAPHPTLRAVQQAIGGSIRDIGPLVKRWREENPGACEPSALAAADRSNILAATLIARIEAQTDTLVDAQERAFRQMQARLSNQIKDRLETISRAAAGEMPAGVPTDTLGDVMRSLHSLRADMKAGFAWQEPAGPAAPAYLSLVVSRLDRLQQRIDELAVQAPAADPSPDPTPQLALIVDRLSRLEQAFATLPGFFDQVRDQLDRLSLIAAAPTPPAALTQALDVLKAQLDDLSAAALPPNIDGPLIPLIGEALHRLDLVAMGLQALHERPVLTPAPVAARRLSTASGLTPSLRKRLDAIAAALPTKRRPPATTSRSGPSARKKTAKRSGSRSKH
jgi:hypothetical protein